MKGIYMKEIKHLTLRGVGWVGKAVLLSLGLLAMLALVVVMGVLTVVVLTATVLPATGVRHIARAKGQASQDGRKELSCDGIEPKGIAKARLLERGVQRK